MLHAHRPLHVPMQIGITTNASQWLVHHGQKEKAIQILAKYHGNGDTEDELVLHEYNEICYAIQLEEENSKTSFRDFVKTPGNRRRLLVLLTMATGTVSSPKTPRLTCCFGVPMAHILSAELGWEWYHHVLPRPGTQDCRNHGQHSNMFAETLPLDKR